MRSIRVGIEYRFFSAGECFACIHGILLFILVFWPLPGDMASALSGFFKDKQFSSLDGLFIHGLHLLLSGRTASVGI